MTKQLTPRHPILRFVILPVNLLLVAAGLGILLWAAWIIWQFTHEQLTFRYPSMYGHDPELHTFHTVQCAAASIVAAVLAFGGFAALISSGYYLGCRMLYNQWQPEAFGYRRVKIFNAMLILVCLASTGALLWFDGKGDLDDFFALVYPSYALRVILSLTSVPIVFTELYLRRSARLAK